MHFALDMGKVTGSIPVLGTIRKPTFSVGFLMVSSTPTAWCAAGIERRSVVRVCVRTCEPQGEYREPRPGGKFRQGFYRRAILLYWANLESPFIDGDFAFYASFRVNGSVFLFNERAVVPKASPQHCN